jgi:hypothetical protein
MPGYVQESQVYLSVQTDNDCDALVHGGSPRTITRTAQPSGNLYHVAGGNFIQTPVTVAAGTTVRLDASVKYDNHDAIESVVWRWETLTSTRPTWQEFTWQTANTSAYQVRDDFQMPANEDHVLVRVRPTRITYRAVPGACAVPDITNAAWSPIMYLRAPGVTTAPPVPPTTLARATHATPQSSTAPAEQEVWDAAEANLQERFTDSTARMLLAPNPANDAVTCHVFVRVAGRITLEVTDALHRVVALPLSAIPIEQGTTSVGIHTQHLSAGIYSVRLHVLTPTGVVYEARAPLSIIR